MNEWASSMHVFVSKFGEIDVWMIEYVDYECKKS